MNDLDEKRLVYDGRQKFYEVFFQRLENVHIYAALGDLDNWFNSLQLAFNMASVYIPDVEVREELIVFGNEIMMGIERYKNSPLGVRNQLGSRLFHIKQDLIVWERRILSASRIMLVPTAEVEDPARAIYR